MFHDRRWERVALAAVIIAVPHSIAYGAEPVRTVALSGQHAPGTAAGVTFVGFGSETGGILIDGHGRVAFPAKLAGPSVVIGGNDSGLWSEGHSGPGIPVLSLVARSGDVAPGTVHDEAFSSLHDPVLNANGHVAFSAYLDSAGNPDGVWSDRSGATKLVALQGAHAPGTDAGVLFGLIGYPAANAAGNTAFVAQLTGASVMAGVNDYGIWSEGGAGVPSLTLVTRLGASAPGTDASTVFSEFDNLSINVSGYTTFVATITGPNVTSDSNQGIWSNFSEMLSLVARSGAHAPGTPVGTNFAGFDWFGSNDAGVPNQVGHIAFHALLGTGVNPVNLAGDGIWVLHNAGLVHLGHTGSLAPGVPAGVMFNTFTNLTFNGMGRTAFTASLTGNGVTASNNKGLWSDGLGVLNLVARTGSNAPGTGQGVNFSAFGNLVWDPLESTCRHASLSIL